MDPIAIALLVAGTSLLLLVIIAVILRSARSTNWPGRMFQYLMLLVTVAGIESVLIAPRDWRGEDQLTIDNPATSQYLVGKLPLIAVVLYSLVLCSAWSILRHARSGVVGVERSDGASRPAIMWFFIAYCIAYSILPIMFGPEHYVHVSLVYPLFVYVALFEWVRVTTIDPVVVGKQCLGLIAMASVVVAILYPEFALEPNYPGLIPGFNVRLWGATPQANAMGSVAGALVVLELAEPARRRWLGACILLVAGGTLVMSQSKTSLAAALVAAATIGVWRLVELVRRDVRRHARHKEPMAVVLVGALMGSLAVLLAWLAFSSPSLMTSVEGRLDGRAVGALRTATGRTHIWSIAIQGGMENPIFGKGANYWREEVERRQGVTGAVHAHNLLLQAFSCAGFVGLASLLMFLYVLFRYSARAASLTRGGSLGMTALFLVRSIFEVPIQPNAVIGAETVALMAYIFYVMDRGPHRSVGGTISGPGQEMAA